LNCCPGKRLLERSKAAVLLVPISVIKVLAPTGLKGVAPSSALNNDGKITGVTADMEYKLSGAQNYTAIADTSVTGLAAGTYLVRYKAVGGNPAGPTVTIVVPQHVTADRYGLIKNFAPASVHNLEVFLLTADTTSKSYYLTDDLDAEVTKGQIIAYGLDEYGYIAAIATKGAVTVSSGLIIKGPKLLSINSTSYTISDSATVFIYDGSVPGAENCNYSIDNINNVTFNTEITSLTSVYLSGGVVTALLIPKSAVNLTPPPVNNDKGSDVGGGSGGDGGGSSVE
jgi:hypothetical protein